MMNLERVERSRGRAGRPRRCVARSTACDHGSQHETARSAVASALHAADQMHRFLDALRVLVPELRELRLVEIAGCDLQPCGGTHVRHTGEIGAVRVTQIEKKGKQNRRVRIGWA